MKFPKLNTQAQQREAVVQGRSLSPYRLRYIFQKFPLNLNPLVKDRFLETLLKFFSEHR
ncbi:MAG: hypothetical protein LBJ00_15040 [Planctomycetaceae bacterium]|nr:hypothetical protein [Planctomycetaceae bacterium]